MPRSNKQEVDVEMAYLLKKICDALNIPFTLCNDSEFKGLKIDDKLVKRAIKKTEKFIIAIEKAHKRAGKSKLVFKTIVIVVGLMMFVGCITAAPCKYCKSNADPMYESNKTEDVGDGYVKHIRTKVWVEVEKKNNNN